MRKEAVGRLASLCGMLCLLPDALIIRLSRLRGDADNESSKLGGFGLLHWRGLGQLVTVTLVHFLLIHGASWQSFSGSLRNALPTPTLFPGGACQMLGQLFFITSIRNTTVANTLLCIAMSPAFSALYSRFFFSEVLPLRTWIAVFLAFVCLLISVLGDLISNPDESATAVIPVALPFFQGGFFSISRYYGSIRRPTADMNPSLAMAGLYNAILGLIVSLGIAGGNEKLLLPASRVDSVYVFLQSAVTVPFGYIFLTTGTRYVQAPEAILLLLAQSFLTPLLVWLVLGEQPSIFSLVGGVGIIIINAVVNIMALMESRKLSARCEEDGLKAQVGKGGDEAMNDDEASANEATNDHASATTEDVSAPLNTA